MRTIRRLTCVSAAIVSAAVLSIAGASGAAAQNWPTRPITVVSPFTAGNASDLVGRVVLDQVSKQIGQPFVLENRPGGGGTIGVNQVAKAEPDGYTVLLHSSSFSAALVLHKNLPYDTLKDFAPVIPLGAQPVVLVTAPSKGFKTVADLVAAAKAKPGAMNFASAGIGSTSHMSAERFRHAAGFQAQHIPFRGPSEAFAEVVSGRVDFYFLPLAPALHLVRQGKVIALAVGSAQRSADLPEVPTISEAGVKNAEYHFWTGLFLPAKTSAAIAKKLYSETAKALTEPTVRERLAKMATGPLEMTSEQFTKYFHDDVASTVKLAKDVGIQPN
jgi:tripartite-type tricarboxylate transporter receptor subunit TctC